MLRIPPARGPREAVGAGHPAFTALSRAISAWACVPDMAAPPFTVPRLRESHSPPSRPICTGFVLAESGRVRLCDSCDADTCSPPRTVGAQPTRRGAPAIRAGGTG
jgi:hypothetical protein